MLGNFKITDIVFPINDFLIEADTVSGGVYICKSGGMGLLTKSANKDNMYIVQKFFSYLQGIDSINNNSDEHYYDGIRLPPVLMDYLLDNDTGENILSKAKPHIYKNAKWMDYRGITALAEMTFNSKICLNFRKINRDIKKLLKHLSKHFRVHLLDNCDKIITTKLKSETKINGHVSTSCELKSLKCSKGNRYDIYEKFVTAHGIDISRTLFVECLDGYIDSINAYGNFRGMSVRCIKYDKLKYDTFITELSNILNISINKGIEFNINKNKEKQLLQAKLLSNISVDQNIIKDRIGSAILGSFIYNSKFYERLIKDNGDIFSIVIYSDMGLNKNERTVILQITNETYENMYNRYLNDNK